MRLRLSRWLFALSCTAVLAGCQSTTDAPQTAKRWTLPQLEKNQPKNPQLDASAATYAALGAHKALAVSLTKRPPADTPASDLRFPVGGYPTSSQAAAAALAGCEQKRGTISQASYACEIRRRDNQWIHNTRELTRDLKSTRPAFLWRLEHNGGNRVYVAGSIHVLKPTLPPPPSYFEAYNEADTLVLEVDQRNRSPQSMQLLMQQYALLPRETTLSSLLSTPQMQEVNNYLQELGIDSKIANHTKPAMLLLQAGLLEYLSIGYLPEFGIETVLTDKLDNRALFGLETIEQQLKAATALPLDLQAQLLVETITEADTTAEQISSLVHAWLSGNSSYLSEQFENNTASEAANRWLDDLLIERNVGMADGIEALLLGRDKRLAHDSPQVVFVLVGAAHLVGEASVIQLLNKRGIATQQLGYSSLDPAFPDS